MLPEVRGSAERLALQQMQQGLPSRIVSACPARLLKQQCRPLLLSCFVQRLGGADSALAGLQSRCHESVDNAPGDEFIMHWRTHAQPWSLIPGSDARHQGCAGACGVPAEEAVAGLPSRCWHSLVQHHSLRAEGPSSGWRHDECPMRHEGTPMFSL